MMEKMGDIFNANDDEHVYMNYMLSSMGENEWLVDYAYAHIICLHISINFQIMCL